MQHCLKYDLSIIIKLAFKNMIMNVKSHDYPSTEKWDVKLSLIMWSIKYWNIDFMLLYNSKDIVMLWCHG